MQDLCTTGLAKHKNAWKELCVSLPQLTRRMVRKTEEAGPAGIGGPCYLPGQLCILMPNKRVLI
jgi:hypothetical protein